MITLNQAILEPLSQNSSYSIRVFSWQKDLADIQVHLKENQVQSYQGFGNTWHYHPELELNVMLEGRGLLFVGDYVGQFQAPDAILLGPNVAHYWKATGDLKGIAFQFLSGKTNLLSSTPEFEELSSLIEQSKYGIRYSGKTLNGILEQMPLLVKQSPLQRLSSFLNVLSIMQKSAAKDRQLLSQEVIKVSNKQNDAISKIIDYIMLNYQQTINLKDILELSQMSRATFHRQFKQLTGSSLSQYVNVIRLEEAKRLILETNLAITNIAFDCGFHNLSHFNARFKQQFKCSPRQLRKSSSEAAQ